MKTLCVELPATSGGHFRGARRWLWRGLRIVALVYIGITIMLYWLQTSLIFPGAATQGKKVALVAPPPGAELVRLTTASGERIVALFGTALTPEGRPRSDAAHRPSMIYFYGNGMCLNDARYEFEQFRRQGANVLVPDYVGYGLSSGHPSEAGCYATADAAYSYLASRPDIDRSKIVASGWSLGGAVAIDLAARRPVAGLAVFSAFTSMADMGKLHFPFLPVSLLLQHRFESESKIARVRCPVLIGHSRGDTLIPNTMADRLQAAVQGQVKRLTLDSGDHGEYFSAGAGKIFPAVGQFLELLLLPPS